MQYDAIIVGAGMSGLAAGIRLSMFGQKVLLLEKHSIPGGLNSYYKRKIPNQEAPYLFDVGLHALTNFIKKGEKGKPFSKILKQLRLNYDDFKLSPQTYSVISFPEVELKFSNDFELLLSEVRTHFPDSVDSFLKLVVIVKDYNELNLTTPYLSSKKILSEVIQHPLLVEMILCPLLIYGSAWEDDMDFSQFVVMFKSLYFEGFSRPAGGVRTILEILTKKAQEVGLEIKYRTPVEEVLTCEGKVIGVKTLEAEFLSAKVFSSMGLPETIKRTPLYPTQKRNHPIGKLSFMESLFIYDQKITSEFNPATIVFYNNKDKYQYQKPHTLVDAESAVVCYPDNYHPEDSEGKGIVRVTFMANYQLWKNLNKEDYAEEKRKVSFKAKKVINKLSPKLNLEPIYEDVFSPTTIEKYTWHFDGTVYGSTEKSRDGRTKIEGLYIIGTDQGFLGIVGAILSGVSIANLYGLMEAP